MTKAGNHLHFAADETKTQCGYRTRFCQNAPLAMDGMVVAESEH